MSDWIITTDSHTIAGPSMRTPGDNDARIMIFAVINSPANQILVEGAFVEGALVLGTFVIGAWVVGGFVIGACVEGGFEPVACVVGGLVFAAAVGAAVVAGACVVDLSAILISIYDLFLIIAYTRKMH